MEGLDSQILTKELELDAKGLTPMAIIPIRYRADDDFNATLPKSRLSQDEVITTI